MKTLTMTLALALAACSTTGTGGDAGVGGAGGSGPCPSGQVPSQQIITTEVPCDLSLSATQCEAICEVDCEEGRFDLGMVGSGCARRPDAGETCRCLCAECRPE